jgi:uncharacterized protein
MRWRSGRRSQNVEDRRSIPIGRGGPSRGFGWPGGMGRGGGIRVPVGTRRGGLGGLAGLILLALVALFFGVDPGFLFQDTSTSSVERNARPAGPPPAADELAQFVSVVLADTEDTWHALFERLDRPYEEPGLVLFSGGVESACGLASAAVGPFYCPRDERVYIDLAFYHDLKESFAAPGDFAQAYVIAHEVGHHVQHLLGIAEEVRAAQQRAGQEEANALSVRLELQADCFAGIWAHHAHAQRQILEEGDIDEALNAASAIGDDRLQRRSQGQVVPESFTHGTSEQRVRWFERGFTAGEIGACNTFAAGQV